MQEGKLKKFKIIFSRPGSAPPLDTGGNWGIIIWAKSSKANCSYWEQSEVTGNGEDHPAAHQSAAGDAPV